MDVRIRIAPPRTRLLVVAAATVAALAAATSVAAADTAVTIESFAYGPDPVTVSVGDSVTWTNNDSAPHTATGDDGSFDTGQLAQGASGSITFDSAGTFAYHCTVHPQMTGSVVVEAAAGGGGGGGATTPPTDAESTGAGGETSSNTGWALAAVLCVLAAAIGAVRLRAARVR